VRKADNSNNDATVSENEGFSQAEAQKQAHSASSLPISDPDLTQIVNVWPTLPDAIKAGILAMVKATGKGGGA
jgi:hypothetical protein